MIINNYGRPYEAGFNSFTGFSAFATKGRYSLYVRGEFQHAPSAPAYPLAARQAIATVDQNPLQPAASVPEVNQFDLLDTYVGVNLIDGCNGLARGQWVRRSEEHTSELQSHLNL